MPFTFLLDCSPVTFLRGSLCWVAVWAAGLTQGSTACDQGLSLHVAEAAAWCEQASPSLSISLSKKGNSPASVNKAAKTINNGNMNLLQIIIDFMEQLKEDLKISLFRLLKEINEGTITIKKE